MERRSHILDITVSTVHGRVRGLERDGVAAFLGIPYAAPPYGLRRMRPPLPPESWSGERDCRRHGNSMFQPGYLPALAGLLVAAEGPGEDCLNLNIWTPAPGRAGGRLPVLVWIHGGAFRNGSGSLPTYDGGKLAADGVVCVSINYRLGAEGFLLLPDGTANLGLLDQIAALRWVHENIAGFGGDPDNVTVFGQSAGAISIATLMTMPRGKGLFRRAILQSGAGHHAHSAHLGRKITERLAALAGVEHTTEALATTPPERLIAANAALSQEISRAADPGEWGESAGGGTTVLPVVDGTTLPARPIDAIAAGAGHEVDVLTGTNAEEFRLFLVPLGIADHITDDLVRGFLSAFGLDAVNALAVYRAARPDASSGDLFSTAMTDMAYRIPAIRLAEARAAHGAPTFVYEFAWPSPARDGRLGACHMAEIGFVFGNPTDPLRGPGAPHDLSDRMRAAWTSFARHGRPDTDRLPAWPSYLPHRSVLRFTGTDSAVVRDPSGRERRLWEGAR
ncbi:carboxylesterase/lipase family protein [Actinoallomurus sp. CA-142502]|uniref:carboxylesterase/lipase family protein n=1 Tax=Actinoallomurus sp. CA-142502 TaxID=3239885 RepID=UPI003D8AFC3D